MHIRYYTSASVIPCLAITDMKPSDFEDHPEGIAPVELRPGDSIPWRGDTWRISEIEVDVDEDTDMHVYSLRASRPGRHKRR